MDIREASADDNSALIELQAKCPQGTTIIVSTVNKPDFFARAKVYENYNVFVGCENNKIIASSACGLRNAIINNKVEKVGYEFQAFVDPDYRGKRYAGQLQQTREEYLKKQGAVLSYGFIMEGNKPSMRYIERRGFKRHRTVVMPSIAVFKEMDINHKGNIRSISNEDLPAVADLLNNTWQEYEFYEPMTGEELDKVIKRIPGYNINNIFILEEGREIKACLGFLDWSKVTEVIVQTFSLKMKVIISILNLLRVIIPLPAPPKRGSLLKQIVLTPIGFKDIRALTALLKYINNMAYSEGIQQIFFVCERGHPMLGSLNGFIHIDTQMYMYIKPYHENVSLGSKPVFINGLDL